MKKSIAEWYIKHKAKIISAIVFIIVIIIVNRIIVLIARNSHDEEKNTNVINNVVTNTNEDKIQNLYNSVSLETDESVVSGETITEHQISMIDTINKFVDYCNNQQVNEAYNLLSNDCKEEMYPDVEAFRQSYYNQVFAGQKKTASLENWDNNIYKVQFNEDFLSTGVYIESNSLQDYITIITDENGDYKLNINSYIGKQDINKVYQSEEIQIKVIQKNIYMDYEEYTYEVTNNTMNTILLDDKMSTSSMYIEDANEIRYSAYTHEISEAELEISPKQTKNVMIKYYNGYGTEKEIKRIVFSRIILNYDMDELSEYKNVQIEL